MTKYKRALVTGGTRGIGFELCKMLIKKNYEVVFTGRTQESVSKAVQKFEENSQFKGCIQGVVMDMTDHSMVKSIPRYCEFDTVIHNAGMLSRDNMSNMCENRLTKLFNVNTLGPMSITKACLPYMKKQNFGNIFFFCPPYKIDAKTRKLTPYMQTKLAQTTFMYSMADILEKTGIKVSGFWTNYPIYTDALIHRQIGIKENCMNPEIIAKMVELMLYDKKENINGNVMIDKYYLLENRIDPQKWALGNHLKSLDDLFIK